MTDKREALAIVEDYIPVYVLNLDGTRAEVGYATDFDPDTGEATVTLSESFDYLFDDGVEFTIYV